MKEENTEWSSCHVRCTICTKDWFAVFPKGTIELECPLCGRLNEVEILRDLIKEQKEEESKTYTQEDMTNFGKYLLSDLREKRVRGNPNHKDWSYDERKRLVHHADFENWKQLQREIKDN